MPTEMRHMLCLWFVGCVGGVGVERNEGGRKDAEPLPFFPRIPANLVALQHIQDKEQRTLMGMPVQWKP